ncbi:dihydrolipoamide acetyltransferase family protein [Kribbella albertanoniae]|uniref:Dihydrolipoamide acetyltransferase component of pyruvate dehydrogenase complex n=1 Tax=Kribbella albertanoniae TaxID=1266829 RepID=A0A4R4P3F6_9ACTN|nr:dihydrolipoamide acetyltransferase family protein [Kribbella albertanoniae]TDC16515.1 2-oxo acid dehydrogenase subunit E2 [Kribbella albertanoniae]
MNTFLLPDLGEGLTEGEIVRWLVAAGDVVAVDTPVAEVETAKSVVELPSPYAGVVEELHGEVGTVIPVGKPLITIAAEVGAAYREEERAGSGNVLIGYGTGESAGSGRRRKPRGAALAGNFSSNSAQKLPDSAKRRVPLVVSPLVRRLARDAEVDLRDLAGTGPDGLIVRRDVELAIARRVEPAAVEETPAPVASFGADSRTGLAELKRESMSGFRKMAAATLSRSRREIPEATTWVDVDATALVELRESLRTATDSGPGLLALMGRFVVAGLAKYPELNGFVDTEREELVQFDGVNLGLAAQTERGLVVPAVPNAHKLTARGLDAEIRRLMETARAGRLTPEELNRGTFTLNNYGSFGVDGSAAIINHPQVAILGVGRIIDRPWVVDGELAVRKLTQLSLVFDHRVCDGGTAAGFLRFVADAFENPASVVADL